MAYWQNGKLYLHGSTQSVARTVASVAGWVGIKPEELVLISEYTGGGFGSKIPGAHSMAIPALLSKKLNGRPVMMRISREEETYIGRTRPGYTGWIKMGFKKDGRMVACDVFVVEAAGPYRRQGDHATSANNASLMYQVPNMRFRGISVATNTPPGTSQRAPGGLQASVMFEPMIDEAARKLDLDRIAIRKINGPEGQALFGLVPANSPPGRPRNKLTSCFVKECLDKGAEMFNWEERKKKSGQRRGNKVTGVAVASGSYTAGSIGVDGLCVIKPDGKLYIHQGIGNLGTHSVIDTARVIAEQVDMPWEKCEVVWGNTEQGRAVELGAGRQPDDLRAHPRQLRGGPGAQAHPAGAGGGGDRRIARRLRRRQRARVPQGQSRDAPLRSRRRRSAPSSSVASSTATSCRRKSTRMTRGLGDLDSRAWA